MFAKKTIAAGRARSGARPSRARGVPRLGPDDRGRAPGLSRRIGRECGDGPVARVVAARAGTDRAAPAQLGRQPELGRGHAPGRLGDARHGVGRHDDTAVRRLGATASRPPAASRRHRGAGQPRGTQGPGRPGADRSRGATIKFLPPYSYDFNPIEPGWALVKKRIRAVAPRTAGLLRCTAQRARRVIRHDTVGVGSVMRAIKSTDLWVRRRGRDAVPRSARASSGLPFGSFHACDTSEHNTSAKAVLRESALTLLRVFARALSSWRKLGRLSPKASRSRLTLSTTYWA